MPQTTSATVRLAREGEATAIARMSRRLIERGLPWRWRPGRIRHHIVHPASTVIVAEQRELIAGFALMAFAETSAHLNLLAVAGEVRRQGIASALLDWLTASCEVAGIGRIDLEVRADNRGAIDFYRRYGFERTGVRHGYYGGSIDAVMLSLQLIHADQERHRPR